MMDPLRSAVLTLRVTAVLVCALSLAGLGLSQARAANVSQSVRSSGLPCNAVCKAYMIWSHRVTAMFHPSRPLKMLRPTQPLQQNAAHDRRPPRIMVHHAPRTRQPGLNSFALWPVPGDAKADPAETRRATETPQVTEAPHAAETPQAPEAPRAEVAPSRPADRIWDRFPVAAEFMARRAGADGTTHEAAVSTGIAVADAGTAAGPVDASAHGADMRLVTSLLLALGALASVRIVAMVRARRDADRKRDPLSTFDRTIAGARRRLMPG